MQNKKTTNNTSCIVCNTTMTQDKKNSWLFSCANCKYYSSSLINEHRNQKEWLKILESLSTLRKNNFNNLLGMIAQTTHLRGKHLLDVGCANGTFIKLAQNKEITVTGIEPVEEYAKSLKEQGFDIICDLFPPKKRIKKCFDIIIFNDVFEHIKDLNSTLQECSKYLNKEGLLIINIPDNQGVFYNIATFLNKFGINNPLERLWQKGSYSPHLHYFNKNNLAKLCRSYGFKEIKRHSLDSVSIDGLWDRLGKENSRLYLFKKTFTWLIIASSLPILSILPKDTNVQFFKKS